MNLGFPVGLATVEAGKDCSSQQRRLQGQGQRHQVLAASHHLHPDNSPQKDRCRWSDMCLGSWDTRAHQV